MKLFRLITPLVILNLAFQFVTANCNMTLKIVNQPVQCYPFYFGNMEVDPNDTVTVAAINGRAPYTYSWSGSPGSTFDSTAVYNYGSSSYAVTVTDANSCSATVGGTIFDDVQISNTNILTLLICAKPEYGNLQLDGRGGTGSLSYLVAGVGTNTTGTFDNLPVGTYIFIIADSLGCTEDGSITIPANSLDSNSVSISTTAITCSTANDGTVTITPLEPQQFPLQYVLDSYVQRDSIFTHVAAGKHTLQVNNYPYGCYSTIVTVDSSTQACPVGCSAHFTLDPDTVPHYWFALDQSTGSGPLSYYWTWGDYRAPDTIATPSHMYYDSGYYNICLTISDSAGCYSTFCDSSTDIRAIQSTVIYVNVVNALPGTSGIATGPDPIISTSIFPNPASTQLFIKTANYLPQSLAIYDMDGRKVTGERFTPQVDISSLAPGLYFIEVKGGGNVMERKRFVKM